MLREVEERGSDRAREKARRMLQMMRGRGDGDEDEDGAWRSVVESDPGGSGIGGSRYRVPIGRNLHGANSTTF